ncbi:phosphotransferase [Paenibacillus sp. HN-1]|uniref:phosphotransferase n=1 Tax=Paenibacillus TaxID=44249 RepID=UPI001CA89BC1|nr:MULTISPECIES: phosphotransferase [Paenibacillus]MBY9080765.1 phosphotransferase [Paenibacillus sp. CGMCC 1.18879]MBY9085243.1 phosphotransferase [Paenibacillus sinensis]
MMLRNEEDINPSSMTELLRSKGLLEPDNIVQAISKELHSCEGSQAFTLYLEYLHHPVRSPASVFMKLNKVRGGEHYKRLTRNEIAFYQLSAGYGLDGFVPKAIDSGYDHDFSYLILDDLSESYTAQPGYSSNAELFYMAVERLAEFHSLCWKLNLAHAECEKHTPFMSEVDLELLTGNHDRMMHMLEHELSQDAKRQLNGACNWIKEHITEINLNIESKKLTLIHGDFHLNNCLFSKTNQRNVKIVDWQWWDFGIGTYDIAHILNLYLPIELKHSELDILQAYYRALTRSGFADYDWAECLLDYQLFTTLNLFKPALYAVSCRLRRQKEFWAAFIANILASYKMMCSNTTNRT